MTIARLLAANPAMLIDGKLDPGSRRFDVINPATEQTIGHAPDATGEELDRAVAAARRAFPSWAATPVAERRAAVKAIAQAMLDNVEDLHRLLTLEQGKPLAEAQMEISGAANWLLAVADIDIPVTIKEDTAERYAETRYIPLGVVGAIPAWNVPVMLAAFKFGPALLTGNTVVLKPSPYTPLTTLRIGELAAALLPPGVLNVVSGGDDLGPMLTAHPGVDKISFTGSTATGRRVMASAAPTLKHLTLELGGNDAAVVMPDVDLDDVIPRLFWAAFFNNGQVCVAVKRMYVHQDIYEPFKAALAAYARTIAVGDCTNPANQIGPLCNFAQYQRVRDLIRDAHEQGYDFLIGHEPASDSVGYFIPVTIIDNPPEQSRIVQEEQFGPVLPLISFDDYDAVIDRVNASELGLGASIWGRDEELALKLASRIVSGAVWLNESMYISPTMAFGGAKQSGIGVEGGLEGLLQYTSAQTIIRRRSAQAYAR